MVVTATVVGSVAVAGIVDVKISVVSSVSVVVVVVSTKDVTTTVLGRVTPTVMVLVTVAVRHIGWVSMHEQAVLATPDAKAANFDKRVLRGSAFLPTRAPGSCRGLTFASTLVTVTLIVDVEKTVVSVTVVRTVVLSVSVIGMVSTSVLTVIVVIDVMSE